MPLKSSATERPTVVVPINAYSDGNPKKRPTGRNYTCIDPLFWLQKVATQWMNDKGEVVPGELIVQSFCYVCQYYYFCTCLASVATPRAMFALEVKF